MGNLQIVSTQNRVNSSSEARPGKNRQAFYWKCVFGVDTPTFVPGIKGWASSNAGEVANGNDFTIEEMFIEIGGVVKQFKFATANSVVVTNNIAKLLGDELNLTTEFGFTPLKGQEYAIKGIVSVQVAGTGKIPFTVRVNQDLTGQQASWFVNTDTISAGLTPGPYTLSSGTFDTRPLGFCPISIGRPTVNVPIIFANGDSIFEGVGDSLLAGIHGRGPVNRATHDAAVTTASLIPCLNFARSGNDLSSVLGASNVKWREWLEYIPANSVGSFNYGTNDIGTGGTGVDATIRTNVGSFLSIVKGAVPTLKCAWMHLMPRTTSAGGQWLTNVDQTPLAAWVAGARGDTHNTWLNTQVGTALVAIYDTSAVRDPSRLDVFKTDGTTNKWKTADGTHLAPSGNDDVSIAIRATNAPLLSTADTTPNAFTFTAVTGATTNTLYTSNTVTISGIDAASPISVADGEYRIGAGAWVTDPGTITNNQTVTVRRTSSLVGSSTNSVILTIGGIQGTYSVTTAAGTDTVPLAFSFTDLTGVSLTTDYISNAITVLGIDTASPISITGGTYSVNAGSWLSAPGNVYINDTVRVKVTSSGSNDTAASAVLTIGTVNDTFTVTTALANDIVPDAFVIPTVTDATKNVTVTSASVTITGLTAAASITVVNGLYSINGGTFTASAGTISNGQSVRVQRTSANADGASVTVTLTIGGISAVFTIVTTVAVVISPAPYLVTDKPRNWVCAGTSDPLVLNMRPGEAKKGIQLEGKLMALSGATVTMYGATGAVKTYTVPALSGEIILIGFEGYSITKVSITGIAAGTYLVKATPLS